MDPNLENPFAGIMVDAAWQACVGQCINPVCGIDGAPLNKECARLYISRERFDQHIAPELRELERLRYTGTAKYAAFLEVAKTYRSLWLIVHESTPHAPKGNETMKLGQVRGALFTAIDELTRSTNRGQ